jgi:hypothetical protein
MVQLARRKLIKWLVPERGIVEMYVNPTSIKISEGKNIKSERTKGGFVIHYWGEELTTIDISGTTGSSGIEGINVLHDVYRAEQLAFDYIAVEEASKYKSDTEEFVTALIPGVGDLLEQTKQFSKNAEQSSIYAIPRPTLGFYASTIEMYYMGVVYRGFFETFSFDETVESLGMFPYQMKFKATSKRGIRKNYMAWHHRADLGPSQHIDAQLSFPNWDASDSDIRKV